MSKNLSLAGGGGGGGGGGEGMGRLLEGDVLVHVS